MMDNEYWTDEQVFTPAYVARVATTVYERASSSANRRQSMVNKPACTPQNNSNWSPTAHR